MEANRQMYMFNGYPYYYVQNVPMQQPAGNVPMNYYVQNPQPMYAQQTGRPTVNQ
ncbi:hypothetical protein RhiirA1_482612, partial [Rhizophagus irregularis]